MRRLRESNTPVIARIEENRVLLDPRTVLPEEDVPLLDALRSAVAI
jgi:L-seryl-tRNA(Ser) seleniumtransferase